jgi:tetratricopeptide (TPR) repeat protein
MMAGHTDSALADFGQVIRRFPNYPDTYRFRATIYAAQHRNALALADYNRAIALAPADPLNVEFRGHFYQMSGNYKAAIADFSIVIARQPLLARAWNSRCWSRLLANITLSQALADCDRSIQLDPTSANAFDSRGYVLYRMNRFAIAIASFGRAVTLNPKLSSAWFGRGLCKLRIHDLTAPRDIAKAKLLEPGIEVRFARYGIKLRANGPSGA